MPPLESLETSDLDRDGLLLPDVLVEDFDQAPALILKPLFDAVWQAAGLLGSMNYYSDGYWAPKRTETHGRY
jgi:hypothetical protein